MLIVLSTNENGPLKGILYLTVDDFRKFSKGSEISKICVLTGSNTKIFALRFKNASNSEFHRAVFSFVRLLLFLMLGNKECVFFLTLKMKSQHYNRFL